MSDTDFRADGAGLDSHPIIIHQSSALHHAYKSDILPHNPNPSIIRKILEFLLVPYCILQRTLAACNLAEANHVRLAQQDENLNRFGHICQIAIGSGQNLLRTSVGFF